MVKETSQQNNFITREHLSKVNVKERAAIEIIFLSLFILAISTIIDHLETVK
jgi:hypothetical protein